MVRDLCYPADRKLVLTTEFRVVIPKWGKHAGYDFSVIPFIGKPPEQMKLRAMTDGQCLYAGKANDGSGWFVAIYYPKLNVTGCYWHLNKKMAISKGKMVSKANTIGYLDTSDYSPKHLHVQFNKGRIIRGSWCSAVVDPQLFFDRMKIYTPPVVVTNLSNTITPMLEIPKTAQERVVNTTVQYALPVAGVSGALGLLLQYFVKLPPDVAVATVVVIAFVFNIGYDVIRYYLENKKTK